MSEHSSEPMDSFEARLGQDLRTLSGRALRQIDASTVAHEIAGTTPRRAGLPGLWSFPNGRLAGARLVFLVVAVLIIALVVALLAAGVRRAPALGGEWAIPREVSWSPDGSRLAFFLYDVTRGSTGDMATKSLYVVSADGSGLKHLATDPRASWEEWWAPAWSPDSRHVAYLAIRSQRFANGAPGGGGPVDLVVVGIDGSAPVRVAEDDATAWPFYWSPSGDRLLHVRSDDTGSDITTVSPDGSGVRHLTSDHQSWAATWSPDGSRILYANGDPNGSDTPTMWVMKADGSDKRRLTSCPGGGGVWSPDGARIYCISEQGSSLSVAPDGSDVRALPAFSQFPGAWSPDGSHFLGSQSLSGDKGITVRAVDGTALALTQDAADTTPSWSAEGSFVAFWGTRAEGTGLFVIPAVGGQPRLIGGNALLPVQATPWRPTATGTQRLAFVRDRSIVTVNADGSDLREILPSSRIASDRGAPAGAGQAIADRMIIEPDGPDRSSYRVPLASDFGVTIENRTDAAWVVGVIDDLSPGTQDCRLAVSGHGTLASYQRATPRHPGPPATVPQVCLIPPHATVIFGDRPWVARGPLEVRVQRGTDATRRPELDFVVLFDFEPTSQGVR